MSRIHVTIDNLSLPEMSSPDRQAFLDSLKSELHGILVDPATRAVWAKSRRTPVLRPPAIALAPGFAGAKKLGAGVAQAIGKGLKP